MSVIFFKELEDNYLQIYFIDNSFKNLLFDSWDFNYINDENINLDNFTRLNYDNNDFEILEIRVRNDDVFYVLLNDLTIIQISSSPNMENEIAQNIYIFKKENKNYHSAFQRFNDSKIYNFDDNVNVV